MKLFGIPVKIEPSFLVMSLILGSARGWEPALILEWVAVVLVSVLIHEMGHAMTCRAFGLQPQINLYSMGGLTSWRSPQQISPLRSIAISLAGPFAGFLTGAVVFAISSQLGLSSSSGFAAVLVEDLLWVNIGWGIFNLLPVLPLDGGNVTTSLIRLVSNRPVVADFSSRIFSVLASAGLLLWALSIGWTWVALLAGWFLFSNGNWLFHTLRLTRHMSSIDALKAGRDAAARGESALAIRHADEVLQRARTDEIKHSALHLRGMAQIDCGDLEGARQTLDRLRALFGRNDQLEALLLLRRGNNAEAASQLEQSFSSDHDLWSGYHLVEALNALGRFDRAIEVASHPSMRESAYKLSVDIASAAFEAGNYDASARAGEFAFGLVRDPNVAYNVSCSLSKANRADEGIEWLKRALEAGFDNHDLLRNDRDIEVLRAHPDFGQLRREAE
jgi:tetratricopeptide (TPR) repeat protein